MSEQKVWATPEYEEILLDALQDRAKRNTAINQARNNPEEFTRLVSEEMTECYNDPVYFIENYLYTDKNENFFSSQIRTLVPFLLFDYQVETIDGFLESVNGGERVFLEKSRQMGISWLVCAFALWGFLFRDWKILFLSQKEDYVDKIGDMQSLFQKIRFMVVKLPKWMLPMPDRDFNDPKYKIDKWINAYMPRLRIHKPAGFGTGSISGESANKNASTGGTYRFVFMDEMAKMENARGINTAVQATTGCIIYNSTPLGKFNEYYRMRTLAIKGKMRMMRLHWSRNPFYTREWYEWKTHAMLPEDIAQEFEINYEGSVEGRVYPTFANIPTGDCKFGRYEYDPYLPLYISIDNSHGGIDNHAIIVAQVTANGKIRIIDSHQFPSYTTIDECASLLAKQPVGHLDDEALNFYERIKDYKPATYIADPYDSDATWNDTSIIKIYKNYGIILNVPERKKTIQERIRINRLNMNRIEVNVDMEDAESPNWDFVSSIQNSRYPKREETSETTADNHKPTKLGSHFRTSFEYLVNFLIEAEESMGIIGGKRQGEPEKVMVQKANMIT